MPAIIKEKEIDKDHPIFYLNDDHGRNGSSLGTNTRRNQKSIKKVFSYFGGGRGRVLVLSDMPNDKGYPLSKFWLSDEMLASLEAEVVAEQYDDGAITSPKDGKFKGDNTKVLPLSNDDFSLVVGRAVMCFCGTSTKACGVPDNLESFLSEVVRVLKVNGAALLHGDEANGKKAGEEWTAMVNVVAKKYDESVVFTILKYGGVFRGIKIRKKSV